MDELICRFLKGRAAPEERVRLYRWREASPENAAYHAAMLHLLEFAESAEADDQVPDSPPAAVLIRRAERRWCRALGRSGWRAGVGVWGGALAAAAVLLLMFLEVSDLLPRHRFSLGAGEFVTGPEEKATVALADGTIVRLGPESRLRLSGARGTREVFLDGQAYFAVAKMPGYPFRVRTPAGDAQVLGTRFEIRTRGEDLRLVVLEGRVALGVGGQEVEVTAGEVTRISEGTTTAPVKVPDVQPLVAWIDHFLVFQSTPLREVAAELERAYGVRVEVTDSTLAAMTLTGWYADRTFDDVFAIVCGVMQASCVVEDGVARIEPAHAPSDQSRWIQSWSLNPREGA